MKKIYHTLLTSLLLLPFIVSAQTSTTTTETANLKDAFGQPLQDIGKAAGYRTEGATLEEKLGSALNMIFALLGVLFIILIVYSGFLWLTASGNETKIKKAKDNLYSSAIGLIIIIGAYAISKFVFNVLL
jgi:hypothetical protein